MGVFLPDSIHNNAVHLDGLNHSAIFTPCDVQRVIRGSTFCFAFSPCPRNVKEVWIDRR